MKRSYEPAVIRLTNAEKNFLSGVVGQHAILCSKPDVTYKNFHARMAAWRQVAHEMEMKFKRRFDAYSLQKTFQKLKDVDMRKRSRYQNTSHWRTVSGEEILEKIARGERICNVVEVETEAADDTQDYNAELSETSGSINSPLLELAVARKPDETQVEEKDWDSLDIICLIFSILKSLKTRDKFEIMGHLLSLKLRELDTLDPITTQEFILKIDELQLELSRALYELKKAQRYQIPS